MATLNATKLLLLANLTKLTLIITLTLTDTVTVTTCISLTPIKRLYCINERNFSRTCVAGFMGGSIFYPFADVPVVVLGSENTSDKSIVHTLSLKEGFFLGCI